MNFMENLNYAESQILIWIQEHLRLSGMNGCMVAASAINNMGMIAIVTVAVLLLVKRYRNVGITAFFSLAIEYFIVNICIKNLVARPRPYVVNEALQLLGARPGDYSFPSGHTGSAFAVAFVIFLCMPKKCGVSAIVVASVIALSRLYNGAHYPTDVLAAWMIACVVAVFAVKTVYPRASAWLEGHRR